MTDQPILEGTDLLAALPVAVYTTDAAGNITFYNEAAAEFWGHRPEIGNSQWCGSWKLFWPDGRALPHDECPMAVTLRTGKPVRGAEAIAERPDGTRVPFQPYPSLLRDKEGRIVGAINLLVDISERQRSDLESERLAAIVSSSDDAIVSKTLEGRITSWNAGATRIFGYAAEEMIGQSILRLIPPELHQEEDEILARLRRGERIDHFETVRMTKDGKRIDISLTVSPLRDRSGAIVGASKVARDVSERKRNDALQRLLFNELNHRVKNTLATIQAIASQSLQRSAGPEEFVASFNGRVQALGRAHDLLVHGQMQGAQLSEIIEEQVVLGTTDGTRITVSGPHLQLEGRLAVQLALVLHELATNARKYGGLSVPSGKLSVSWRIEEEGNRRGLCLYWQESGIKEVRAPTRRGFGTTLIERSLQANGGKAKLVYEAHGLSCELRVPLSDVEESTETRPPRRRNSAAEPAAARNARGAPRLQGRRVLVVEDEPLVAMELETQLESAGCEVVGPACTIAEAQKLIAAQDFDMAVLDANLGGDRVDSLAVALTKRQIPFAFATGYGRDALPLSFQEAPLLAKPFNSENLLRVIGQLLAERDPQKVVSLREQSGPGVSS